MGEFKRLKNIGFYSESMGITLATTWLYKIQTLFFPGRASSEWSLMTGEDFVWFIS